MVATRRANLRSAFVCESAQAEQGVKTKTQLLAERNVLVTLLSAVIAAAAEDKLGETAAPFARDVCRHFAMLFAAGTQVCVSLACNQVCSARLSR